jgi:hypothetical protein
MAADLSETMRDVAYKMMGNQKKEDKAILTITTHIGLMSYMALYDVFGFKEKRIRRYYDEMQAMKFGWADGQVPTDELLQYCENNGIHVYAFVKRVPTSTKLKLIGNNTVPGVMPYLESGFLVNILMSVKVLKEKFRFTKAMLQEYLDKIEYYIDSYTRKQPGTNKYYLNDDMILEIFRDEMKLDLNTGEKVA